jgi:hypothetical protein
MKLVRNEKGFKFNDLKPFLFFVPRTRFELARRFQHHHLKVACLPVSTPGHFNWVANLSDLLICWKEI